MSSKSVTTTKSVTRNRSVTRSKSLTKSQSQTNVTPSQIVDVDTKTEAVFRRKNYKILKKLAHGAFGQVYKGVKLSTNEIIAIKVMELSKLSLIFREKFIPRELGALIACRHENVMHIYDIIRANNRLYIFMEFAPNGNLSEYLRKHEYISEKQARLWFCQVIAALIYTHEHLRMAHRDIKLDNVLLDQNNNAKLTDFGFAKECWDPKRHCVNMSQTFCGTEPYFCPQIVDRVPYNAYLYDVWAMGVMLFAMLNNRFPFHFSDPKIMLLEQTNYPNFIRTRFVSSISEPAVDLVVKLLDPNEKTRMTLHEALDHPWIVAQRTQSTTTMSSRCK